MRGERKKMREQRRRTATRNLKKISEAEVAFFFCSFLEIIRSIIAWVVVFPPMINRDYR